MPEHVIFIIGPTAVGKSAYAVDLALAINGEIISADSMQVYKGFDIGTSKPTEFEKKGIHHHMIDVWDPADPDKDFSAAAYSKQAQGIIAGIISRKKQPIVCGGSGLYIHALLYELDFSGRERNLKLRNMLIEAAKNNDENYLFAKLLEVDPEARDHIHPHNTRRIIRALERVYGNVENAGLRSFENTFSAPLRYNAHIIHLTMDRQKLYEKIERRTEVFFAEGLIDEVEALIKKGVPQNATAMQGIGYKEVAAMLAGEYDKTEAVRLVKRNTRRYAKRQETWFKRYANAEIIEMNFD